MTFMTFHDCGNPVLTLLSGDEPLKSFGGQIIKNNTCLIDNMGHDNMGCDIT